MGKNPHGDRFFVYYPRSVKSEKGKDLNVRLDADVKAALVTDAETQNASLNDVGVSILAEHFRIRFERTGRPYVHAAAKEGSVIFRLPAPLWRKIHSASGSRGLTKRDLVAEILSEHYLAVAA